MLSSGVWVGEVLVSVLLAILLTTWVTFTLTRLDRLHARVDSARAALDAQLVRRAAALLHLTDIRSSHIPDDLAIDLSRIAHEALAVDQVNRQASENGVGRAIARLNGLRADLPVEAVTELSEAATRVLIARRFFNDAVRDTRTLRARRMPRLLHLAGRRELPQFFDIDDTSLFVEEPPTASSSTTLQ